jgi:hypothetical protein
LGMGLPTRSAPFSWGLSCCFAQLNENSRELGVLHK